LKQDDHNRSAMPLELRGTNWSGKPPPRLGMTERETEMIIIRWASSLEYHMSENQVGPPLNLTSDLNKNCFKTKIKTKILFLCMTAMLRTS